MISGLLDWRACSEYWVFRDTSPFEHIDDTQRVQDLQCVNPYFDAFRDATGAIAQGVNAYLGAEDPAAKMRYQLRRWIDDHLDDAAAQPASPSAAAPSAAPEVLTGAQQALLDALLRQPAGHETPAGLPRDHLTALMAEPVRGLRGYLLRRYAQWSRGSEIQMPLFSARRPGKALQKRQSSPSMGIRRTSSAVVRTLSRPPPKRASTKVPSPTRDRCPGLPAAMSQNK